MSISPISIPFNPLLNFVFPITENNEGLRFSYDDNGYIFYYSPKGYPYYLDEMNQPFYLSEFGERIYFDFDYRGDIRIRERIHQHENYVRYYPLKIQSNVCQKKDSKKIDFATLSKLFNIKNEDKKIVFPYLSDHSIIWYEIKTENDDKSITLASWNLLRKGKKYSDKFQSEYNNPWNCVESKFQYENRIRTQTEKIINIIKTIDSMSIFLLQGAYFFYENKKNYDNFLLKLKEYNWAIIKSNFHDLDLLTLYNANKLTPHKMESRNIFTTSQKKYSCLHTFFIDRKSEGVISIGNIHFPPQFNKDHFKRFIKVINQEKRKLNHVIIGIYGGTLNQKKIKNPMIANEMYPSNILRNGLKKRKDGLAYVTSDQYLLKVEEKPSFYFNMESMSLSIPTYNVVDPKTNLIQQKNSVKIDLKANEFEDYIKKVSQKLDMKILPHGKLFLSYDKEFQKYLIKIYDKEKATNFIEMYPFLGSISQEQIISRYSRSLNYSYYTFSLSTEQAYNVLKNLLNENDYSLLFDLPINYNTHLNKDFFEPFIPYSKKEKKTRKTQVLL